jgi:hypothetical protein
MPAILATRKKETKTAKGVGGYECFYIRYKKCMLVEYFTSGLSWVLKETANKKKLYNM